MNAELKPWNFQFKSQSPFKSVRIREVLDAHPEWSDTQVCEAVANGCTTTLVSVVRSAKKRKDAGLPSYAEVRRRKLQRKKAKKAKHKQQPIKFLPVKVDIPKMVEDTNKFFDDVLVHSPVHYTQGGIETYDFIKAKGLSYELGNVVKYITRAKYKGNTLQDLKKAQWYLNAAIKIEEAT